MPGWAGSVRGEYASAVRIEPLPERLHDAAIRLWQDSGLTRPWNDPEADLRRAVGNGSSCVLAAIGDDDSLLATAMVGHDGHRGWVYYMAVAAAQRGRGLGKQMMEACEDWVRSRGIPKIQLMVRATNRGAVGFYEHLGYADSEVVVLGRRLDGWSQIAQPPERATSDGSRILHDQGRSPEAGQRAADGEA
jgi:hypothetical protein